MELKNSLVCAVVLGSLLGGSVTAFAQEKQIYPTETEANTNAEITFTEDEGGGNPVDPTDPGTEVDPVDPVNPGKGELMITYVSNFQFGTQEKTQSSWQAQADVMKDGRKVMPFVSTKDSRGTDRKGWSLSTSLSKDFTDSSGNKLKGAELKLSNLFYSDKVTGAPTATAGEITLGTTPQEVASANAETGIGFWSLGLGELQSDDTTNGVTLTIPTTSAKNTDTYTAELTWELTTDATK